jgi:antitoxin component of MazEF toxin-antitoxin module
VYEPEVVYVLPFHAYESQAVTVSVVNNASLIINTKVAVESQPTAFVVE